MKIITTGLILVLIFAAGTVFLYAAEDPYDIMDMVEEQQSAETGKSEISMMWLLFKKNWTVLMWGCALLMVR